MGRAFLWTQCNYKHSYEREAEGDLTTALGDGIMGKKRLERGQSHELRNEQFLEAGKGKEVNFF